MPWLRRHRRPHRAEVTRRPGHLVEHQSPIGSYGVSFGGKRSRPNPCGPGAAVVRVDQTTGATGATYGLTTMLTGVSLNLNDVTSLWLCPKVANGFVTEP